MALEDFYLGEASAAAAGLVRAYLRSTSGLQGTDTNPVTGWTDATGNANAELATASVPTYEDDPGDGNGPVAVYSGNNGFLAGVGGASVYQGGTEWCFWRAFRFSGTLSGFQNVVSDDAGGGFDIYLNGSTWTLADGGTTETFGTAVTDTDYRLIVHRDATSYRIYLNGTLVHTSTLTPSETPLFVTSAFGGSSAPMTGRDYAWGIYSEAKDADTGALDAAILEEIQGAATEQELSLSSHTEAVSIPGPAVALDTAQALTTSSHTEAVSVPGPAVAVASGQSLSLSSHTEAVSIPGPQVVPDVGFSDDFAGDGDLIGYTTQNASAIATLGRVAGRYRALIPAGDAAATTFFDEDEGRLDAKQVSWAPGESWEIIFHNVGVGTAADSQAVLANPSNRYMFCGWHLNADLSDATQNSIQVTVGHRGPTHRTIEGKSTIAGSSSVGDIGHNALTGTRADIRIVGENVGGTKSVTVYWREPGATTWILYDDTVNPPGSIGTLPTFPDTVWVGPITYGFEFVDEYVGTIDAIELVGEEQELSLSTLTEAVTVPGPAVALASPQALTTATHTEAVSVPGPAVALGSPLSLSLSSLTESASIPGPAVANDNALELSLSAVVEAVSLPGPSVALGTPQPVTLSALVEAVIVPGPAVALQGTVLSLSTLTEPVTVPGPAVAAQSPQALSTSTLTEGAALPGPTVVKASPQSLTTSDLVEAVVVPGPGVAFGGDLALSLSTLVEAVSVPGPALAIAGDVIVATVPMMMLPASHGSAALSMVPLSHGTLAVDLVP